MTSIAVPLPVEQQMYLSVSFANQTITGTHYFQVSSDSEQPALSSEFPCERMDLDVAKK